MMLLKRSPLWDLEKENEDVESCACAEWSRLTRDRYICPGSLTCQRRGGGYGRGEMPPKDRDLSITNVS